MDFAILFFDISDMNISNINRGDCSHLEGTPFPPSTFSFSVLLVMSSPHQVLNKLKPAVFSPVQPMYSVVFYICPFHQPPTDFAPRLGLTSQPLLVHTQALEPCSSPPCPWDEHRTKLVKGTEQFC